MSQPIRGQGGHFVFPISPKNTNLVEGVEILLPVKFRWIPFSSFREEVQNVKVYARRTDDGRCAMTIAHSSLRLRWAKNDNFWITCKFMRRYKVTIWCLNVSANQRPGRPSCFSDRLVKHKLGRGHYDLAFCQVSLNSVQLFKRRSRKCESLCRRTDDGQTDGRTTDGALWQ